jgi:hypothetical protein
MNGVAPPELNALRHFVRRRLEQAAASRPSCKHNSESYLARKVTTVTAQLSTELLLEWKNNL